ncbi:MAG: hypothetical protein CVU20_06615 [Betaproteobacteria bacterium HGW-Betaproteobacteria-14]|nr:MAG: hypothetical protein CVU20_06615 [Betaproteobacteria bacterium HGW-Betaproteobacteria-14]
MKTSLAERVLPVAFLTSLDRILEANNKRRASHPGTVCSLETRRERRLILRRCFAELWEIGFRLKRPGALGDRHIQALATRWYEEGLVVASWHNRISILRTFSEWIQKPGMVRDVQDYFQGIDTTRVTAAQTNRAWQPNGVMPEDVIEQARQLDERLALYLELQFEFGLRVKESIEMRPAHCLVESGKAIEIYEGTKGGRLRRVDILNDDQRRVFDMARDVAARTRSGRLRWNDLTWRQAQRRFYYQMNKLGITRKQLGITAHGLRHGYAQDRYRDLTGQPPPLMVGEGKLIDRDAHHQAGIQVARDLGHGRPGVSTSYYGTHGHSLRKS